MNETIKIDLSEFYNNDIYKSPNIGILHHGDLVQWEVYSVECYFDGRFISSGSGTCNMVQGSRSVIQLFDTVDTLVYFRNIYSLLDAIKETVCETS